MAVVAVLEDLARCLLVASVLVEQGSSDSPPSALTLYQWPKKVANRCI